MLHLLPTKPLLTSLQFIPQYMKFDPHRKPPCFISTNEDVRIAPDDDVRLKIVGIRVDATEIVYSQLTGCDVSCVPL